MWAEGIFNNILAVLFSSDFYFCFGILLCNLNACTMSMPIKILNNI